MAKTKSTTVTPLGDRVLVKRVEADEKTKGGIILPDTAKEKPREGIVVAVGAALQAGVLAGERKLSSELKDRVAAQLAASVCADTLAENVRARLNRSGIAVDEFKRNLAQRIERGRDALHQFELPELPELPSVEELRAKARQKFAHSPSMDDIVLRARLMLGEAVTTRLAAPA